MFACDNDTGKLQLTAVCGTAKPMTRRCQSYPGPVLNTIMSPTSLVRLNCKQLKNTN
jgi:hypothetical protein